jgi:hypothetical protein
VARFERVAEGKRSFIVARAECNCGAVYEARRELPPVVSVWELGILESSVVEG